MLLGTHRKERFFEDSPCHPFGGGGKYFQWRCFFELQKTRPAPWCVCLFTYVSSKTNHSLRKPYKILFPYARPTRYTKSFLNRSALLWNSLPHAIQSLTSKTQFKAALEKEWEQYKYTAHILIFLSQTVDSGSSFSVVHLFSFIISSVKFSVFVANQRDPSIRETPYLGNP